MGPKLSIIIVNWNTNEHLRRCIDSIYGAGSANTYEIIVVDNNSVEDVRASLNAYPSVKVIRNQSNTGFAVANNIGFAHSRGEYLMTLNPDTIVSENMVDSLISELDADPTVGIVFPKLTGESVGPSQFTFSYLFFPSIIWRNFRVRYFEPATSGAGEPFDVDFFGGTGYACRRAALPPDHFFVEDNFLFGEEYYLCRYVREKGFKIRVVPTATLEHHTSVTFKTDHQRLAVATKLGAAVAWKIRNEEWGRLKGHIVGLLLLFENVFLFLILKSMGFIRRKNQIGRSLMVTRCKAMASASVNLILHGDKYRVHLNKRAKSFLNSRTETEKR